MRAKIATILVLCAALAGGPVGAEPGITGSITGTITDESGKPLDGACAVAVTDDADSGWHDVATASSDPGGRYLLDLDPGWYRIRFEGCAAGRYVTEWYEGEPYSSTAVRVTEGVVRVGIDASLELGGRIMGRVTDRAARALADVEVTVSADAGTSWNGGTRTVGDGTYGVIVPAGLYRVHFIGSSWETDIEWPGLRHGVRGLPVAVEVDRDTTDIDAEMAGGAIEGTVTLAGEPVEGACVFAYGSQRFGPIDYTDADGRYSFVALPAEDHVINFRPCGDLRPYGSEWYRDAAKRAGAERIPVRDGSYVADADADLSLPGRVAGTVRDQHGAPLAEACVSVWDPVVYDTHVTEDDGRYGEPAAEAVTDQDGTFEATVAEGTYIVQFRWCPAEHRLAEGLEPTWYDGASDRADAITVAVVSRETRSGIDADLITREPPPFQGIRGTVRGDDGSIPSCARVQAALPDGTWEGSTLASSDGTYRLQLREAGEYVVFYSTPLSKDESWCDPGSTRYASEWYDDSSTRADAVTVIVPDGGAVDGIDARLTVICRFDLDPDADGLDDCAEWDHATDPADPDTDGDGLGDGIEIAFGSNPNDPDSDADGLRDGDEYSYGTDPWHTDTDGDRWWDGAEVHGGTCRGVAFEGGSDPRNPASTPLTGSLEVPNPGPLPPYWNGRTEPC